MNWPLSELQLVLMIDMGNEKLYISLAKMACFWSLDEGLGPFNLRPLRVQPVFCKMLPVSFTMTNTCCLLNYPVAI